MPTRGCGVAVSSGGRTLQSISLRKTGKYSLKLLGRKVHTSTLHLPHLPLPTTRGAAFEHSAFEISGGSQLAGWVFP